MKKSDTIEKIYGEVKGTYKHGSIKKRIEALFLDNIGKTITREQILRVAKDPNTGQEPENWHQRLSELRREANGSLAMDELFSRAAAKRPSLKYNSFSSGVYGLAKKKRYFKLRSGKISLLE